MNSPPQQIAQYPLTERSASRLLVLNSSPELIEDRQFMDIGDYLKAGDLLVFNDTKVIPARLFGQKQTGGKVELLLERILSTQRALCHIRASKAPRVGAHLMIEGSVEAVIEGRQGALFEIFFPQMSVVDCLKAHGHIPLPPYIARHDEPLDVTRYQTVYARHEGAVAAPTAGLHFDQPLLDRLITQEIALGYVTLHVGAGTFAPLRTEALQQHVMHAEQVEVSATVCEQIRATKAAGGRVVAVGTTVVRSLEAAAQSGQLQPFAGDTTLFIQPGWVFRCVDAMITNFHLPRSTLLMLVCAFGGYQAVMQAYQYALANDYRFYSYGDAMLIFPQGSCHAV